MPSPTRPIYSSSSSISSKSPPATPSPTTPVPPQPRRTRRRRPPRHAATTPAATILGIDSPPNYSNQPFQPEQQTAHHASTSTPLLQRALRSGGSGARAGVEGFYGLSGLNLSNTSLDSSVLLDHREQDYIHPRRNSFAQGTQTNFGARRFPGTGFLAEEAGERGGTQSEGRRACSVSGGRDKGDPRVQVTSPGGSTSTGKPRNKVRLSQKRGDDRESDGSPYGSEGDDETPLLLGDRLLAASRRDSGSTFDVSRGVSGARSQGQDSHFLRASMGGMNYGSVNFPPSVPTSPRIEPVIYLDGANLLGEQALGEHRADAVIIDIDGPSGGGVAGGAPSSAPTTPDGTAMARQPTLPRAEEDVCFPVDECLSGARLHSPPFPDVIHDPRTCRRTARQWPDLSVLEEWSREEKEQRSEGIRAKKTSEPVYVGGRLRPNLRTNLWHRQEEEAPFRFTYFNDELPATIHAHTISELLLPGQTFLDLFRPEPRKYGDQECEEEGNGQRPRMAAIIPQNGVSNHNGSSMLNNHPGSSGGTPSHYQDPTGAIGNRPTWWLDVLSPMDAEMKVLSKAFGIHPLTAEDIMMQEAREKVELFRHYYLVSYKSFEHDTSSEDYLSPVNFYIIVFREGVLSFHFSLTPHPANVRRRIRQLKDYITVSPDWISYALIDDITDAFAPLIQGIEEEVDDIDERILQLHAAPNNQASTNSKDKAGSSGTSLKEKEEDAGGNMLKRVGDCRKKVMGLYRLLGNKADVIKGFAKRCNEQWEVAPRSEIGLYLGDIQDHIVTMVANLNHYEKILSRSHSNYLAQINIAMNERQEKTADVLGRLTVLGTIVLPMNIITGLWGMNVLVPGQDIDNLNWFGAITVFLLCFGLVCYFVAKRVYGIV